MKNMNKNEKYQFVFDSAKEFLDGIIAKHPDLNNDIMEKHLQQESKFDNIFDVRRRLVESLSNRNMMASVINFKKREKEIESILYQYDPQKILTAYKNPEELLEKFRTTFNLTNIQRKRNLWRQFSEGIISGSQFMSSFKDKNEFDSFVKSFTSNSDTRVDLPILLSKKIQGFGFALACDFLKELGYREYPKPDVHLIRIFYDLGLCKFEDQYEVYKSIIEMSEIVGEDAYTVDKIFWLISSGRFYLINIETGRNRDKFIETVKAKLGNVGELNKLKKKSLKNAKRLKKNLKYYWPSTTALLILITF